MVHLHTWRVIVALRRIGHWGPGSASGLPDPRSMAGSSWDAVEREDVTDFLTRGFVSRAYLGYANCRICGENLGSLELSDGIYCWPEGLHHYVQVHGVGLPREFIDHVLTCSTDLMSADVNDDWWIRAAKDLEIQRKQFDFPDEFRS